MHIIKRKTLQDYWKKHNIHHFKSLRLFERFSFIPYPSNSRRLLKWLKPFAP